MVSGGCARAAAQLSVFPYCAATRDSKAHKQLAPGVLKCEHPRRSLSMNIAAAGNAALRSTSKTIVSASGPARQNSEWRPLRRRFECSTRDDSVPFCDSYDISFAPDLISPQRHPLRTCVYYAGTPEVAARRSMSRERVLQKKARLRAGLLSRNRSLRRVGPGVVSLHVECKRLQLWAAGTLWRKNQLNHLRRSSGGTGNAPRHPAPIVYQSPSGRNPMRSKMIAALALLAVALAVGVPSARADQITLGGPCTGGPAMISGTSVTGSAFTCPDTSSFSTTPSSNNIFDLSYTLTLNGTTAGLDITCGVLNLCAGNSLMGTVTWLSSTPVASLDVLVGTLNIASVTGFNGEYQVNTPYEIDLTLAGCASADGALTCTTPSSGEIPTAPVPEPASMLLFGSGLATIAGIWRRKHRA